jgi:hypothetical protein
MRIQAAGLNRTTPGEKLSIILDLVRNWREFKPCAPSGRMWPGDENDEYFPAPAGCVR